MKVISVAEKLLFSTVRIESIDFNGVLKIGTGFIFSHNSENQQQSSINYVVTCKHVVEDGVSGSVTFLTGKSQNEAILGKTVSFSINENFNSFWFGNSNKKIDVAIFPLNFILNSFSERGVSIFLRHIDENSIPTEKSLEEIDALEEVIFIGYPWGLWDEINKLPIFRRGITATPITVDFEGDKKFLIDASVFHGSSGSPVFIFNKGGYFSKSGQFILGETRLLFVGIISEAYYREIEGKIEYYPEKTSRTKKEGKIPVPLTNQYLNIGIVFKTQTIIDTIQELRQKEQEWKENIRKIPINLNFE